MALLHYYTIPSRHHCCLTALSNLKTKITLYPPLVEGCYGGLCLYPDCWIYAVGCFSWGIDLAMHVLGKFSMGLVISSTKVGIRLL